MTNHNTQQLKDELHAALEILEDLVRCSLEHKMQEIDLEIIAARQLLGQAR